MVTNGPSDVAMTLMGQVDHGIDNSRQIPQELEEFICRALAKITACSWQRTASTGLTRLVVYLSSAPLLRTPSARPSQVIC